MALEASGEKWFDYFTKGLEFTSKAIKTTCVYICTTSEIRLLSQDPHWHTIYGTIESSD